MAEELPDLILYWDIGFQREQRVFNGPTPSVGPIGMTKLVQSSLFEEIGRTLQEG